MTDAIGGEAQNCRVNRNKISHCYQMRPKHSDEVKTNDLSKNSYLKLVKIRGSYVTLYLMSHI